MGHVTRWESKKWGARWQAAVRGLDGHERTKTFARKVDAERWIATQEADKAKGRWVDPRAGKVKLTAYAEEWLKGRTLRPTTRARYRGLLDLHILPTLGATQLGRLEAAQVRAWYTALRATYPATAAGAYRLLSAICKTAVDDELIARSPCRLKGAGSEHPQERPVATPEEVARVVQELPERWQPAILLAAWCQLRRGEILGLQRADVNPLKGTVGVSRTWTTGGEGPPKTAAGRRTVSMPEQVTEALKSHLERHVGADPRAWLFEGRGGEPVAPRTLNRVWTEAAKAAELPALRLHDLRHSGLTWTATAGATAAELMHRAGHSSPAAAMRYQHAQEERDRALANALSEMATASSRGDFADKTGLLDAE